MLSILQEVSTFALFFFFCVWPCLWLPLQKIIIWNGLPVPGFAVIEFKDLVFFHCVLSVWSRKGCKHAWRRSGQTGHADNYHCLTQWPPNSKSHQYCIALSNRRGPQFTNYCSCSVSKVQWINYGYMMWEQILITPTEHMTPNLFSHIVMRPSLYLKSLNSVV